jgi:small subunit ribosomal protein S17e
MGKIKTRLIKRTAKGIVEGKIKISTNFDNNKKILQENMPSKKVRNQIAGFLTRIAKTKKKIKKQLEIPSKNTE